MPHGGQSRSGKQVDHMRAERKWRSFLAARAWARKRGIRSETEWRDRRRQGEIPNDIPSTVSRTYKDEWISWGDFLGTGVVASQKRIHRSFVEARKWARSQGLRSQKDWIALAAANKLPDDIPLGVRSVYGSEWQGMGDFLGSDYVSPHLRRKKSFAQARRWARKQGLKSEQEWRDQTKKVGWLPFDIPVNVYQTYKRNGEWTSWGDFLGSGNVYNRKRPRRKKVPYRSFDDARKWARAQEVKSKAGWLKLKLPDDIPVNVSQDYKDEFVSWGDFLGTENIAPSKYDWPPFSEAQAWARSKGVTSVAEWRELVTSLKAKQQWPKNIIPTNVQVAYKSEWKGWEDFLGVARMTKLSKVEIKLRHELASVIPEINLNNRSISIQGEKKQDVDIHAPALHLVIEFDGNHWHSGKDSTARDRKKTELLQKAGWTVVRIREHPLEPITATDVQVPTKLSTFNLALSVLKHLAALKFVEKDVVARYEKVGRLLGAQSASLAIREVTLPFEEARAWVRAQGITSQSAWAKAIKQDGWLPKNIPRYPLEKYRDECATWGDFLGTKRKATWLRIYLPFKLARKWARAMKLKSRTDWNSLVKKKGWLPEDIPANPYQTYMRKGEWTDWGDFLGTGNSSPRARR